LERVRHDASADDDLIGYAHKSKWPQKTQKKAFKLTHTRSVTGFTPGNKAQIFPHRMWRRFFAMPGHKVFVNFGGKILC